MKKFIIFLSLFISVLYIAQQSVGKEIVIPSYDDVQNKGERCKFGKDNSLLPYDESMKTPDFIAVNTSVYEQSTYSIEDLVTRVLIGDASNCVGTVSNVKVSPRLSPERPQRSWGYFNKAETAFPFDEGLVLATGFAKNIGNNYLFRSMCTELSTAGDEDLAKAIQVYNPLLFDASFIEFDFVPLSNRLSFDYMFASEEYFGTFSCEFNDGFALLIKKKGDANYINMAKLPVINEPVSVVTIHPENDGCGAINSAFYAGDNEPEIESNFRGRTIPLTASAVVIPGQIYHIKIVMADFKDRDYDSGIFLKAGSFKTGVSINDDQGNYLPPVLSLCEGTTKILNAELPTPGVSYQWYYNGAVIPGATLGKYTATQAGIYKVEILIPGAVCSQVAEIEVNFVPKPYLIVTAPKTTICYGEYVVLTADGADLYTFSGLTGTESTRTVSPQVTTTYYISGTRLNGCQGNSTSITITVVPRVTSTLKNIQFCEESSGILDAGAGLDYTYLWSTGETTQKISVEDSGTYTVTIDNGGCSRTFSATVTYTTIPIIDEIIYKNSSLTITVKNPAPGNLEYTIDGGLTWQNSNVFTVLPNTNYSVAVRVQESLCYGDPTNFYTFYISNFISTNLDGVNDTVDFTAFSNYENFNAIIFDRYGKEVFRATPLNTVWKGQYIKTTIPTSAYWYQTSWIDPATGALVQKTGWIYVKNRN